MAKSSIGVGAALLLGSILLAAEAQAQEQTQTGGRWRVYEENDFFNPFTEQTDRYYTQGLKVERLAPPVRRDAEFLLGISHAEWCSLICGKGAKEVTVDAGYAGGQNIYTPADITIAAPQPNDRPWAGLLYGSRIAQVSYEERSLKAQRQDRIEVSLGMVGPIALAKGAQTVWHEIIGADEPKGWDNQLRNEPVLQLRYDTALRWPKKEGGNVDVIGRVRGNLGNALTSVETEATLRVGWNLTGFGVDTIRPALPLAASAIEGRSSALTSSGWLPSANLFARAGMRAVAHNIFLDGNSFVSNDIRIRRKPFVPEFAAGFEVNLAGDFWVTYQFIHRGSEFESRRGRDAPSQQFGAITVAWTRR